MEIYEYTLIAASPSLLFFIICFVIMIINWRRNGKLSDLMDYVVLNGFPAILETKKNERNQTLVYMREENVLLRGKTLKNVKKALFGIFMSLIIFVFCGFGQLAFIEYPHNCEEKDQGCDCFKYPDTTVRANRSDPDIIQGKKLILCYRLVFQFELAVGVSYGMYRAFKMLLCIASNSVMKMNESHTRFFKIIAFSITVFIIYTPVVVVLLLLRSKFFLSTIRRVKFFLYFVLVNFISYLFILAMPWAEIIEEKNRSNTEEESENLEAEFIVQYRRSGVQEMGSPSETQEDMVKILAKAKQSAGSGNE